MATPPDEEKLMTDPTPPMTGTPLEGLISRLQWRADAYRLLAEAREARARKFLKSATEFRSLELEARTQLAEAQSHAPAAHEDGELA